MNRDTKFTTVKEYFDFLPEHIHMALIEFRACILYEAPGAIKMLNCYMNA